MVRPRRTVILVAALSAVITVIGVYAWKLSMAPHSWFEEFVERHPQALSGGDEAGEEEEERERELQAQAPAAPPVLTVPSGAVAVEQRAGGRRPAAALMTAFDGLGVGFAGPHGTAA